MMTKYPQNSVTSVTWSLWGPLRAGCSHDLLQVCIKQVLAFFSSSNQPPPEDGCNLSNIKQNKETPGPSIELKKQKKHNRLSLVE